MPLFFSRTCHLNHRLVLSFAFLPFIQWTQQLAKSLSQYNLHTKQLNVHTSRYHHTINERRAKTLNKRSKRVTQTEQNQTQQGKQQSGDGGTEVPSIFFFYLRPLAFEAAGRVRTCCCGRLAALAVRARERLTTVRGDDTFVAGALRLGALRLRALGDFERAAARLPTRPGSSATACCGPFGARPWLLSPSGLLTCTQSGGMDDTAWKRVVDVCTGARATMPLVLLNTGSAGTCVLRSAPILPRACHCGFWQVE